VEVRRVNYTLAKDGDDLERQFWSELRDRWPNYEILWQHFVAPMTMRVVNRGDVRLRPGMDCRLEEMCMAHYYVFYHLAQTHELVVKHGREARWPHYYDDIFFHMSAATEMAERFLLALRKVQSHVEGLEPLGRLNADQVIEAATHFYEEQYHSDYARLLDQGRSVNMVLHTREELIRPVLVRSGAEDIATDLWKTANDIREYRNVLTHNPHMPMLVGEQEVFLLPKRKRPSQYRLWSAAFFGDNAEDDYVAGPTLVEELLEEFETRLNALWGRLIPLLTAWSKTERYAAMQPPVPDPSETSNLVGVLFSRAASGGKAV
jgi:hypothetical protein